MDPARGRDGQQQLGRDLLQREVKRRRLTMPDAAALDKPRWRSAEDGRAWRRLWDRGDVRSASSSDAVPGSAG
jgi:hypothetical protein